MQRFVVAAALAASSVLAARQLQDDGIVPTDVTPPVFGPDVPLALGMPLVASVGTGGITYYSVTVPLPFSSLYFSLTPQYGNSDLYVNVAGAGRPTRSTFQYSAAGSFGSDGLTIFSTDAFVRNSCLRTSRSDSKCQFLVGVYGSEAASYILSASIDANVKALPVGLPMADSTTPNRYVTYAFTPSTPAAGAAANMVTFSLAPYAGAAGLYIGSSRLNQTRPRGDVPVSFCASSVPAADGSTSSIAYGTVTVDSSSPCWCDPSAGPCTYYLSVGGDAHTSFSVVATEGSQGVVQLLDGLASRAMGTAGATALYDFVFVPAAVSSTGALATITLTQVGGEQDAVLYARVHQASDSSMVPTAASAHFTSSVVAGSAILSIPRNAPVLLQACPMVNGAPSPLPCRVHVAVFTPVAATYSIQARTDIGQQLFDAIPVTGDARTGSMSYYRFQHSQPLSPLVITVTTGTGPVEVYVSNNGQAGMFPPGPGEGKAGWSFIPKTPTTAIPVQTITVFPTDAGACVAPCTYVIGVAPSVPLNDPDARITYSVMARTRDVSTVQLLDGRPTTDVVSSVGGFNYYSIVLPPTAASLTVALSALSGSATAYGTFDGTLPSPDSALRGGFSSGVDRVGGMETSFVVSRFDERVSRWCNRNVTRYETVPATQIVYVTAYRTVVVERGVPATITIRDPVTGETTTEDVMVLRNVTETQAYQVPTTQNITVQQAVFDITPLWCTLQIGVTSDVAGSGYSLTAATRTRLLPDSLSLRVDVAAGEVQYFAYEAAAGALRTTLSLTNIIGKVVAYVSTVNPAPSAFTAQYVVGGYGASAITLDPSANGLCDPSAVRCIFYLAVTTQGPTASSALLLGSSFRVTPMAVNQLVAGRIGPSVGNGAPAYYSFTAPTDATDIEITVEPLSGGWVHAMLGGVVDAQTGVVIQPTATCARPAPNTTFILASCNPFDLTLANAGYAVQGLSSRTRLRVSSSDGPERYTPGSTYVLALSSALDTEYIVNLRVLANPAVETTLPSGVMLHDTLLDGNQIFYYSVIVPVSRLSGPGALPIRVQVTPVQSDVLMYLGVGNSPAARRPSQANAVAIAGFPEGYRFVLDPAYVATLCPVSGTCQITVGVQAAPVASVPVVYGIHSAMGADESASVQLSPGVPQLGSASRGAYAYYHIPTAGLPPNTPLFVSMVEVNDGEAPLLVNVDGRLPTIDSFSLTSAGANNPEIVALLPGTPAYASAMAAGRVTVGVYGLPSMSTDICEFYITVGTTGGVTELPDGATIDGSLQPGSYAYYSLNVPGSITDVEASITPLSGSAVLTASVYYKADALQYNPALRPGKDEGSYTWKANFEGTLFISAVDPAACSVTGACAYILAVYCPGRITCQYELSATTNMNVPVRLALGVPQMGYLPQGQVRYYIFDGGRNARDFVVSAQTTTGEVAVLVSDNFQPGVQDVLRLPTLADPSTYRWSSDGQPIVQFSQQALMSSMPAAGAVPQRSERIYVVAIVATRGPASFSMLARHATSVVSLPPGITSTLIPLAWQQSVYFDYDNQDTGNDLVVAVTLLYGSVTITAGTGSNVSACVVTGPRITGSVACTGGIWQVTSVGNTALLRISAAAPCRASGLTRLVGECVPARDWRPTLVSMAVSAMDDSLFQIVATTGADPLRAYDGTPLGVTQTQGDRPTVVLFQTTPDVQANELHITLAASSTAASADYYLTSCIDYKCTELDKLPGPGTAKLTGQVQAGARQEIIVKPSSPAYCNATTADICNYYLVMAPNNRNCLMNGIVPCSSRVDVTFFSNNGGSPILVDFSTLNMRITTMANTLRQPEFLGADPRYTHFNFYINRPGAPDEETIDVVTRLDACDSLRGFPSAFMCVSTPGPDRVACTNPRRPRPGDGNNQYALSTVGGGIDRAFLLSEPSNELYVAVGLTPHVTGRAIASEDAMRRWGPSMFELQIINGPAVRMRLPFVGEGVLSAPTFVRVSSSVARLSWSPVVMTADNAPNSDNTTSTGVTYRVYFAPESFTSFASAITGAAAADLGIVASTPCGLERWASILNDNTQPIVVPPGPTGMDNTNTLLTGLVPDKKYRVAVVAVCDDDCLSANHLSMGFNRPDGPLSTQRLAYGLTTVVLVDPSPSPSAAPIGGGDGHGEGTDGEPVSPAMYSMGALVTLGFVGYVLFVAFRKKRAEESLLSPKAAEGGEGAVEAVVGAGSEDAVLVTVNPSSHFTSSRKLAKETAPTVGGGAPDVSLSAGRPVGASGTVQTQAELQALQRITQRVFQQQGEGGSSGSNAAAQP